MEIIIHGKPNAGSSKSTSPSDVLSQKIVGDFFDRRDEIVDQEALIVDARNWNGIWYSVYTYRLFNLKEISENVGRSTYFAISLIIPNSYCCLVSEVFAMLRKVYNESILGTYISDKGKYIVQNFDDSIAFEKVIKSIKDNYANLEENFDSKFVPQPNLSNEKRYSILDCDSKSFIQCLRTSGRIIVTETEKSKDDLLTKTNEYVQKLNQAQTEILDKNKQIEKLNKNIDQLGKDLSEANNSTKGKVQKLQNDLISLSTVKENLQKERDELNDLYNGIKEKFDNVANILGLSKSQNNAIVNKSQVKSKSAISGWYNFIPLVNTLLILLLMLILLFNIKGCYSFNKLANVSDSDLSTKIDSLIYVLSLKNEEVQTIPESMKGSEYHGTSEDEIDEDCQITIYQDNHPVKADDVDLSKKIMIIVGKPISGYQFYSDNLKDVNKLKASMPIMLEPKDKNKPIIISYRSAVIESANPKNKFEFK